MSINKLLKIFARMLSSLISFVSLDMDINESAVWNVTVVLSNVVSKFTEATGDFESPIMFHFCVICHIQLSLLFWRCDYLLRLKVTAFFKGQQNKDGLRCYTHCKSVNALKFLLYDFVSSPNEATLRLCVAVWRTIMYLDLVI